MRIPTTRASAKNRITARQNTASAEESRMFKHILVRAACNGSGPAGESPVAVSDPRMPCSHT